MFKRKSRRSKQPSTTSEENNIIADSDDSAAGNDHIAVQYLLPEEEVRRHFIDAYATSEACVDATDGDGRNAPTLYHGRRCHSATLSNSHVTDLFCTDPRHQRQQLQQQPQDVMSRRTLSSSNDDDDNDDDDNDDDDDYDVTLRNVCDQAVRRHPTLDELFCTQWSASPTENSTTHLSPQRYVSSADSDRKQWRRDVSQFLQMTSKKVRKFRKHMKKNKVKSNHQLPDLSTAVYPRQQQQSSGADHVLSVPVPDTNDSLQWPVIVSDHLPAQTVTNGLDSTERGQGSSVLSAAWS